mmetsp:Transcript_71465/g.209465  ORF Transcript_71465/g.209465 Transcript_71465/m.209465 type:complete len:200 (+) Transcript_71465:1437-2036(+)
MTNFAYARAIAMRTPIMTKVLRMPRISGFARLGCMASTTMAQMSWKIKIPMVNRPAGAPISPFSPKTFATIIVEEMPQVRPQYMVEYWPAPKDSPAAPRPPKIKTMTPAQMGNWRKPVMRTTLPIFRSSLMSSSMPIMNRRKMRPSSLSSAMSWWLSTIPRTSGPTSTPPSRYPRISGCFRKFISSVMKPAPVREKAML